MIDFARLYRGEEEGKHRGYLLKKKYGKEGRSVSLGVVLSYPAEVVGSGSLGEYNRIKPYVTLLSNKVHVMLLLWLLKLSQTKFFSHRPRQLRQGQILPTNS